MPSIHLSKKALLAQLTPNTERGAQKKDDEWLKDRISFLGTDLEGIRGDDISVEIFPNRPDLLSQQGFNRAFLSFVGEKTGLREYKIKKGTGRVIIEKSVSGVRPFTACALVRGLHFTDEYIKEIIQTQEKLHVTYGRNRKRCAIGIYPLEHITLPITYKALDPKSISFQALESNKKMTGLQILSQHPAGREYGHLLEGQKLFPVFMDAKGDILSMPPIINSEKTGRITEKTTEVFIECSGFSWHVVHGALAMLATELADMGGTVEEMTLDYPDGMRVSPSLHAWELPFEKEYVEKYLGYQFTEKEVSDLLAKMGLGMKKKGKELLALIPSYRTDILHPIDLVEDIAIAYGMENVESVMPKVASTAQENILEAYCTKVREILIGHGLLEIKNFNISNANIQEWFGQDAVQVAHSASSEYDTLRLSVMSTTLATLKKNKHYDYPQNIFEIGEVFWKDSSWETGVGESKSLAVSLCGEGSGYTAIRQILDSLLGALDISFTIEAVKNSLFIPGRGGRIMVEGKEIGVIGEIDPSLLSYFELEMPVASFEIDVKLLKK